MNSPHAVLPKRRVIEELQAISLRYPSMRNRSTDVTQLRFEGIVEIDGTPHRVRLTLPMGYPKLPPLVQELNLETGEQLPPHGRLHDLGPWGLCLFPHGADDQAWRPERLAVDALDRFGDLIRRERDENQQLMGKDHLHIPPTICNLLADLGPGTLVARRRSPNDGDLHVIRVEFERSTMLDHAHESWDSRWESFLPVEVRIPWIEIKSDEPWNAILGSSERINAVLQAELSPARCDDLRRASLLILARKSPTGAEANIDVACVCRDPNYIGKLVWVSVVRDAPADVLFHRVDGVISHRDRLAEETVILVGLGSLGSTVALALARAGIQRFVLIDPDTLNLENVCRHVGTLHDLGRLKVELVADLIRSVNPTAEVVTIPKLLAWDLPWLSAGAEFEDIVTRQPRCMIVCTCAEHVVERQLNALAVQQKIPVIYAAALGAAEHGRIFRVRPDQSPCWECILDAQNADPARFPRFSARGVDTERTPAYVDASLPGLGIDITAIAMLTARFTLQTIAELRDIDLGLPRETGDHLLWTNRGAWLFDRPQQLIVEHFPKSPNCPVCGPPAPTDDDGDLDELLAMALAQLID